MPAVGAIFKVRLLGFFLLPPSQAVGTGQNGWVSLVGRFPKLAKRRAASRTLALLVFYLAIATGPAAFASVSSDTETPDSLLDPPVEPTPVLFAIAVLNIHGIDQVQETWSARFRLTLQWHDRRLAGRGDRVYSGPSARARLDEIWSPDLNIGNSVGKGSLISDALLIAEDGRVVYTTEVDASLFSEFDFRAFPFDEQVLRLEVASHAWDREAMSFDIRDRSLTNPTDESIEGWTITDARLDVAIEERHTLGGQRERVALELQVARDPFHFVGRMVIPLLLIVAAAYSGFFHRDASAIDRVLLAMSALIAAVAFNFVIASSLPHISYLTWLDGFVILAYVAIFSTLVLHTIAGALERRSLTAAKIRLDRWSQILFPVVYLLMVLLLFL